MSKPEVRHLGCAGHLIVSSSCRWRRHTQVGDYYRISTVGEYFPPRTGDGPQERETIGYERFYETMVFRTLPGKLVDAEGCGCMEVENYQEIDMEGYQTAGEAQAGHERYVQKYVALLASQDD